MLLHAISPTLFFLIPLLLLILAFQPNPVRASVHIRSRPVKIYILAQIALTLIAVLAILVATLGLAALTKSQAVAETLFVAVLQSLVVYIISSLSSYRLYVNALIVLLPSATLLSLLSILLPVHVPGIISPVIFIVFSLASFPLLSGLVFSSNISRFGGRRPGYNCIYPAGKNPLTYRGPPGNDADARRLLTFPSLSSFTSSTTIDTHHSTARPTCLATKVPAYSQENRFYEVDLEIATTLAPYDPTPTLSTTAAIRTYQKSRNSVPLHHPKLPTLLFVAQFQFLISCIIHLGLLSFPPPLDQASDKTWALRIAQTVLLVVSSLCITFSFSQYVRGHTCQQCSEVPEPRNSAHLNSDNSNNLKNSDICPPHTSSFPPFAPFAQSAYTNIGFKNGKPHSPPLSAVTMLGFPLNTTPEVDEEELGVGRSSFSSATLDSVHAMPSGSSARNGNIYPLPALSRYTRCTLPASPPPPTMTVETGIKRWVTPVTSVTASPHDATPSAKFGENSLRAPRVDQDNASIAANCHGGDADEPFRRADTPVPLGAYSISPPMLPMLFTPPMSFAPPMSAKVLGYYDNFHGVDEIDDVDDMIVGADDRPRGPIISSTLNFPTSPGLPRTLASVSDIRSDMFEALGKKGPSTLAHKESFWSTSSSSSPSYTTTTSGCSGRSVCTHKYSHTISSSSPSLAWSGVYIKPTSRTFAMSSPSRPPPPPLSKCVPLDVLSRSMEIMHDTEDQRDPADTLDEMIRPSRPWTRSGSPCSLEQRSFRPQTSPSPLRRLHNGIGNRLGSFLGSRSLSSSAVAEGSSSLALAETSDPDNSCDIAEPVYTGKKVKKTGGFTFSGKKRAGGQQLDDSHHLQQGPSLFHHHEDKTAESEENVAGRKGHRRRGSLGLTFGQIMRGRSLPIPLLGNWIKRPKDEEEVQESQDLAIPSSASSASFSSSSPPSSLSLTVSKNTSMSGSANPSPRPSSIRFLDDMERDKATTAASSPVSPSSSLGGIADKKVKHHRIHGKLRRKKSRSASDLQQLEREQEDNGPADFMDLRDPFAPPDLGARGPMTTSNGSRNGGKRCPSRLGAGQKQRASVWGRLPLDSRPHISPPSPSLSCPAPRQEQRGKTGIRFAAGQGKTREVKTSHSQRLDEVGIVGTEERQSQRRGGGNVSSGSSPRVCPSRDDKGLPPCPTDVGSLLDPSELLDVEEALLAQRLLTSLDLAGSSPSL